MDALVFDSLDPKEIPVSVGNRKFVLREASSGAFHQRQTALSAATIFNDKGFRSGYRDSIADIEPLFLSLCLLEIGDGGEFKGVSIDEIKSWPTRITEKLTEALNEISGLGETSVEELKKQRDELDERIKTAEEDTAKNSLKG